MSADYMMDAWSVEYAAARIAEALIAARTKGGDADG